MVTALYSSKIVLTDMSLLIWGLSMENFYSEELLDRKSAAKYLGGSTPLSPGTLAVWDCTKRYDLKPIKVGRSVRYRRSVLDSFLEERQKP